MSLLTDPRTPSVRPDPTDTATPRSPRLGRRVLITPEWYPWPDQPGFGIFCREQALVVSSAHDVVVLAWRRDEGLHRLFSVSEANEAGLRTFRVRFRTSRIPKLGSLYKLSGMLLVLTRLRRRDRWVPEIVHAHEYAAGLPALLLGSLTGASVVVSEHASDFALGRLRPREVARARRVFRRAAVVSPVSRDLARRLAPLAGSTPLVAVPNSIDTRLFSPGQRAGTGRIELLSVGNLVEVKGHRYLIEALELLRDSGVDASLDMVGDGHLRPQLEHRVEELGIGDRVRFHGHVPKQRVAEMMRRADVFVLPSLWENMPCVLLEAMAAGLPAVASSVGGVPEIIDRASGVLAEPGSPAALAAAVQEVARSRGAYDPRALHENAARRYGHEAIGDRWTGVYELARTVRKGTRLRSVQPATSHD
jgi:glycosyltransferase involved in cell wall biosynthesis